MADPASYVRSFRRLNLLENRAYIGRGDARNGRSACIVDAVRVAKPKHALDHPTGALQLIGERAEHVLGGANGDALAPIRHDISINNGKQAHSQRASYRLSKKRCRLLPRGNHCTRRGYREGRQTAVNKRVQHHVMEARRLSLRTTDARTLLSAAIPAVHLMTIGSYVSE